MENITNPIDQSSHSIFSNIGQNILKKYLNVYANFLGGKTVDVTVRCDITNTGDGEQNITCKNLLEIPRSNATSEEIIEERLRENAQVINDIMRTTPAEPTTRKPDNVGFDGEVKDGISSGMRKAQDLRKTVPTLEEFEDFLNINKSSPVDNTENTTTIDPRFATTRPSAKQRSIDKFLNSNSESPEIVSGRDERSPAF